jgi:CRISPR system Cascade subunit CasE
MTMSQRMSVLYLSRLSLRRDASLAALAPLLVPSEGDAQFGAAHSLVWAAFADDPERRRDFLWRQDEKRRWLVLSSRQPDDPHRLFDIETKPFAPVLEKSHKLIFALRANCVVTRKDKEGRPRPVLGPARVEREAPGLSTGKPFA